MGALAIDNNLPLRRSRDREYAEQPQNAAALVIDGQIVMIDTNDYKLTGEDLAAVCRWDGSIGLEYPKTADGRFWAGERSGFHGVAGPTMVRTVGCVILGRVIEAK